MTGRGFTLIELMIVLAIVAILMLLAIPSQLPRVGRNQIVDAFELTEQLKPAIKSFYDSRGYFPIDNKTAGLPEPRYLIHSYVKQVIIDDGVINIEFGNKVTEPLKGKILSIRPLVVKGSPESPMSWLCGVAAAPEGMEVRGQNRTTVVRQMLPLKCRV
ncbi:MAG: hypothetical protein BMS9Abin33_0404 [Gammaproteobacteria bacterium]|nr:MAG: hypothetical protein BMS9Abin33_0404 [Gammaproteobacteria bacterium]